MCNYTRDEVLRLSGQLFWLCLGRSEYERFVGAAVALLALRFHPVLQELLDQLLAATPDQAKREILGEVRAWADGVAASGGFLLNSTPERN